MTPDPTPSTGRDAPLTTRRLLLIALGCGALYSSLVSPTWWWFWETPGDDVTPAELLLAAIVGGSAIMATAAAWALADCGARRPRLAAALAAVLLVVPQLVLPVTPLSWTGNDEVLRALVGRVPAVAVAALIIMLGAAALVGTAIGLVEQRWRTAALFAVVTIAGSGLLWHR